MATAHSTLTGADLHEPKGVASANADDIYIANGSGSGAWTAADNNIYLSVTLANVSAASSVWIPSPCTGNITKIQTIINGAIATSDVVISTEINGTAVTNGNITITQSGSAAGDVDSSSPSANRTLAIGNKLEVITNGASTNTVIATVMFTIAPT